MPYNITKVDGFKVTSPHGTKAKETTKKKAEAQIRLLHGVEHGMVPRKQKKHNESAHEENGRVKLNQYG